MGSITNGAASVRPPDGNQVNAGQNVEITRAGNSFIVNLDGSLYRSFTWATPAVNFFLSGSSHNAVCTWCAPVQASPLLPHLPSSIIFHSR